MPIPDAVEIVDELARLLPDWVDLEPGRWQRVEYALRAADLIIEVVSPESSERDRFKKYNAYEAAGVSEFWLIDLEHRSADFHQLVEGRYQVAVMSTGVYDSSELPGLRLPVAWFWQFPTPMLAESLRVLGLLD